LRVTGTRLSPSKFFESSRKATTRSDPTGGRGRGEGGRASGPVFPRHAPRVTRHVFEGFDPGSERTLAAWIRHASRTRPAREQSRAASSGARGSKAWATCPQDRHSPGKPGVIPGDVRGAPAPRTKGRKAPGEGLTWYYLVGGVTAHQGEDA